MESKNFKRICPKCGKTIVYKRLGDKTTAVRKNTNCKKCSNEDVKFKKGTGCLVTSKQSTPKFNLEFLFDGSLQSMYFLGLIVSDGSFYKTCFEITLKKEDDYILELLSNFCGGAPIRNKKVKEKVYRKLSFNNKKSIENVMKYFDIKYQKTYNPIEKFNINSYTFEQVMAFIVGCIDGDGSCYIDEEGRNPSIVLTHHKNWNSFYSKIFEYINLSFNRRQLKNKSVCTTTIAKTKTIILIRDFIIKSNLTVLSRKWDKFKKVKINEKIKNSYRG